MENFFSHESAVIDPGCKIGAGTVVTKTVPDYALVLGNPARQTGWMSEYGHKLNFKDTGKATCPESGEEYVLTDGNVHKSS